jgi:two-component system, response regulator PdtaR
MPLQLQTFNRSISMAKTGKANILIVEDDKNTAIYIRQTLEDFGFDAIEIAVSGEEAIRKAKEMNADMVLMDIVLKGRMDGIEAAVMIREQLDIPIIYLTAYSDDKRVQRAKATKPVGYLLKPFQQRDLLRGIEIALQQQ